MNRNDATNLLHNLLQNEDQVRWCQTGKSVERLNVRHKRIIARIFEAMTCEQPTDDDLEIIGVWDANVFGPYLHTRD